MLLGAIARRDRVAATAIVLSAQQTLARFGCQASNRRRPSLAMRGHQLLPSGSPNRATELLRRRRIVASSPARMRTGSSDGGVGHNLPQEAEAFAEAIVDVDGF